MAAGVEIRVLSGTGKYGIMHNKFVILDGQLIQTGSMNWSVNSVSEDYNNIVFRDDPALIAGYTADWAWLWSQSAALNAPMPTLQGTPPQAPATSLSFKGLSWPEYAFTPGTSLEYTLVDAIRHCRQSIDIAMFSFFAPPIADALLEAKNNGVTVRLVIDSCRPSSRN